MTDYDEAFERAYEQQVDADADEMRGAEIATCAHAHTRQVSEHDVECLDCGLVSA